MFETSKSKISHIKTLKKNSKCLEIEIDFLKVFYHVNILHGYILSENCRSQERLFLESR